MRSVKKILKVFYFVIAVVAVKIFLDSILGGPQIIPDETCIAVKAKALINQGGLIDCSILFNRSTGNPFPLYSILIAPLYVFFKNDSFYHSILVFNSLLIVSLIYPLKKILENVSEKAAYDKFLHWLLILIVLFIPSVLLMEHLAMTETLFTFLSIWCLHFYIKSFIAHKVLNKSMAVFLSILAVMTRPFGFAIILSIIINEISLAKKTKKNIMTGGFALCFIIFLFLSFNIETANRLLANIGRLGSLDNIPVLLQSFVTQVNSLVWAVFFVPAVLFFYYIFGEKNKVFLKIRVFLFCLVGIIFLISLQHLFGYYFEKLPNAMADRYINLPIILVTFFGLNFLFKKGKLVLNKKLLLIILFFSFSQLFKLNSGVGGGISVVFAERFVFDLFTEYFLIIIFFTTTTLLMNYKKMTLLLVSLLLIANTILADFYLVKTSKYANDKNHIIQYIDKEWRDADRVPKILYLSRDDRFSESFWSMMVLKNYKVDVIFFDGELGNPTQLDLKNQSLGARMNEFTSQAKNQSKDINVSEYDYLISALPINWLELATSNFNLEFLYKIVPL